MTAIAHSIMLTDGWRRLLIALLAGLVSAAAMPPFFILPGLFLGMTLLVWLIDGMPRPSRRRLPFAAFGAGWAFGFGYFVASLHWIGTAFFVDPALTGWLAPAAIIALPAILALFFGAGTALAHLFWSDGGHRVLALAGALSLTEYLRGHILTGFPWNLPGYALTGAPQLMQGAAFIGVYGLTFLALAIAATPALLWPASGQPVWRRATPLVTGLLVLVLGVGGGQLRLDMTTLEIRPDMRLRLVQPDIAQEDKWRPGNEEFILARFLDLSAMRTTPDNPGLIAATHLIWPESAFPFLVAEHPNALARIARLLPPGTTLITGAAREEVAASFTGEEETGVLNSILAISDEGEITATYDKLRLVPFGEFLPFRPLFAALGFSELVASQSSFAPGAGTERAFAPAGTPPVLPLICYEAIFSGDLGAKADNAEWILNLTNDAWFAGSIGPDQHFHHARLRAVEEGLPLVRVANTGVTALVDPLGRITAKLSPDESGVLDGQINKPVNKTAFSRYRDAPLLLMLLVSAAIVYLRNRAERSSL